MRCGFDECLSVQGMAIARRCGSGAHQNTCTKKKVLYKRVKCPEGKNDGLPAYSNEIKVEWSFNITTLREASYL
jgi:hypothetical protein